MNKLSFSKWFLVLLGIAYSFALQAEVTKLTIGAPAPKLRAGQWIQGEPVLQFDSNHIYIVEFWATWCGPCIASIPHLNELAQKFKDKGAIVIGQDVLDKDDAVLPFVKKMGDKMAYRVALDDKTQDPDGFMGVQWWKRKVENHSIPAAVIINKAGRVAWIGHPMELNEKLIEDVLADKFDIGKFAAQREQEQRANQELTDMQEKLFSAINEKRWTEASSALDELLNKFPRFHDGFTTWRFKILLGQKKFADAWDFADAYSNAHPTNALRQNDLAWAIVAPQTMEQRNLDLAQKLAERANQAAQGKQASFLDTLARVQFMNGKRTEAIETEQKALDAAPPNEKARAQESLASYESGKLPEVND